MKALYIGTFDPITSGHIDIIERASKFFDKLYIYTANNSAKNTLLPYTYREHLAQMAITNISNVEYLKVETENTIPDIMKENNIHYLVRCARISLDLIHEHTLYSDYLKINPDIEEILLWSKIDISSTFIRECIKYHKWDIVRKYVPTEIASELIHLIHG